MTLTQPLNTSLTISKAVSDGKPVKQLVNEGYSLATIEGALGARILEASAMLHIGGNLLPHEPIKIAQMLVNEYPTSSLDDFTIMLQRGITGRYGKIFGFDVSVVFGWMGMYLEEWAEEKERQLSKEKNKLAQQIEPEPGQWSPETEKLVRDFQESLRNASMKSVPKLTRKEIYEEGQSTPPKPKGISYPSTDPEYLIMNQKKLEWARECTDLHTGKILPGALSFNEWLATDTKTTEPPR